MYGKTLADYPGKFELFREALSGLSEEKIDFAFKVAIRTLKEFPVPAQIVEFAQDFYGRPEQKPFPKRDQKPEGWAPVDPNEVREWTDTALSNLDRTKAMDAPASKSIQEHQRETALQRLGGTTMPSDPEKRMQWHNEIAVRNGWKPARQPGEDE